MAKLNRDVAGSVIKVFNCPRDIGKSFVRLLSRCSETRSQRQLWRDLGEGIRGHLSIQAHTKLQLYFSKCQTRAYSSCSLDLVDGEEWTIRDGANWLLFFGGGRVFVCLWCARNGYFSTVLGSIFSCRSPFSSPTAPIALKQVPLSKFMLWT